jgi:hypothetical protein
MLSTKLKFLVLNFHSTYFFVLSWHLFRTWLEVLSYMTLRLWPSPHLHVDANGRILVSRVVTSSRSSRQRRRRGPTHLVVEFVHVKLWHYDHLMSWFWTLVVMNLVNCELLSLCTLVVMNFYCAVNVWICVSKLSICEVVNVWTCYGRTCCVNVFNWSF